MEILEEEAIFLAGESSMEEDEEKEGEDGSWAKSSWLRLGFAELEEAKDIMSVKECSA